MKKTIGWIVGIVLGLLIIVFGTQMLFSELGSEIVELHTLDDTGQSHTTRLWIVNHEGTPYVRAGMASSGWLLRALSNNSVEMTRHGVTGSYTFEHREQMRDTVNQLLLEKYTWGFRYISFTMQNADSAIPVALIEN